MIVCYASLNDHKVATFYRRWELNNHNEYDFYSLRVDDVDYFIDKLQYENDLNKKHFWRSEFIKKIFSKW